MQVHNPFEQLLGESEVSDEKDEDEKDDNDSDDDADGGTGYCSGMKPAGISTTEGHRLIEIIGRGVGRWSEVGQVVIWFQVV